jgi:hypothetical protein
MSSVEALGCNLQITSRSTGKRLHHDNTRPHTARATQGRIKELQWELLEHPPYSQDLVPSDFHLFGLPKKKHLVGKHLAYDEEVETDVRKWLGQQSKDFYATGFDALVKEWDTCIYVGGGYLEKQMFFPGSNIILVHVLHFISICDLFTNSPS